MHRLTKVILIIINDYVIAYTQLSIVLSVINKKHQQDLYESFYTLVLTAYKDQEFLNSKDGYRKQMITYKEEQPHWESALILHKGV